MPHVPLSPHSENVGSIHMRDYLIALELAVNDLDTKRWTTFNGDTGTTTADVASDTLTIAGGTGVTTSISGDTVTIDGDSASVTVVGVVELATSAETNAGTAINLAVTPDGIEDWEGSIQFTTAGTITTGTWQGTAITNTYLADTAVSYGGVSVTLGAADATPAFDLSDATAYLGDSSLVTTGTITSGTWQGTTIAVDQGGSGQTSYTNGQLLIGNTTGNTLAKASITGGTEITVTNGASSITIDADFTPSSTDTLTGKTFDANGTGNSVSNIDVADLANGTDGELITWGTSSVPETVAVGTTGQVLTSGGVGVAPTFQSAGATLGRLVSIQTFTATGTWTRPSGVVSVVVYCTAGGGGGGGTGTTSATESANAGGGGGGGTAIEYIAAPSSSETVTIGAAGAAGLVDADGGAGGTSSFGTLCSATGGAGGDAGDDFSGVTATKAAAGGIGSGGDINLSGGYGNGGFQSPAGSLGAQGGTGGSSFFGGGSGTRVAGSGNAFPGVAAQVYGAGGSGAANGASQTEQVGGAGSAGVIYVFEYS